MQPAEWICGLFVYGKPRKGKKIPFFCSNFEIAVYM